MSGFWSPWLWYWPVLVVSLPLYQPMWREIAFWLMVQRSS
jgi:hypothetical protein